MIELRFLGTAAGVSTGSSNIADTQNNRVTSSTIITIGGKHFVVDTGEGFQQRLLQSGFGMSRINNILITHGHIDHIMGLSSFVASVSKQEMSKLSVFSNKSAANRIKTLVQFAHPKIEIQTVVFDYGCGLEFGKVWVTPIELSHRVPSTCFVFETDGHFQFDAEAAKKLNVPADSRRSKLIKGESVFLDDGTVIKPEQVVSDFVPGSKLIYVGDCKMGTLDDTLPLFKDADVLIIEGTYLDDDAELALKHAHMTIEKSCEFAERIGAKSLFINHTSNRYPADKIRQVASANFHNVVVVSDLESYSVKKGKIERR